MVDPVVPLCPRDAPPAPVTPPVATNFLLDITQSAFQGIYSILVTELDLLLCDTDSSTSTVLKHFGMADLLVDPTVLGPDGNPAANYKLVNFTPYLPAVPFTIGVAPYFAAGASPRIVGLECLTSAPDGVVTTGAYADGSRAFVLYNAVPANCTNATFSLVTIGG